jgi:hypothetical protein
MVLGMAEGSLRLKFLKDFGDESFPIVVVAN